MSELSASAIRAAGGRTAIGNMVLIVDEVASTNDVAIKLARMDAPHGSVVVARAQTAGRGRRGHSWWHDAEDGVAYSVLLRPELEPARAGELVHVAALALDDAVHGFGVDSRIKWPNDIVVVGEAGRRKLAGVLIESAVRGSELERVVVGIGVNVNTPRERFDPELAPDASSLAAERGARVDRNTFIAVTLQQLERWLARYLDGGFEVLRDELRRRSALIGETLELPLDGARRAATVVDIDPRGALVVETDDGARHAVVDALD